MTCAPGLPPLLLTYTGAASTQVSARLAMLDKSAWQWCWLQAGVQQSPSLLVTEAVRQHQQPR